MNHPLIGRNCCCDLRILLITSFFARYEQDLPRGRKKEKVSILSPDIEDVFGMKLHQMEKTSCLVGETSISMILLPLFFELPPFFYFQLPFQMGFYYFLNP